MISKKKYYNYSRYDILKEILDSQKINNNLYWCPDVPKLLDIYNVNIGYDDLEFVLPRNIFKNKYFYTNKDINYFLNREYNDENFNYNNFIYYNNKFYEDNKDIVNIYDINTKLKDGYKLSDLIVCYLSIKGYNIYI